MSLLEVQHINPGAVTKRLDKWAQIQDSDLVMKTIINGLDDIYEYVWKAAPVKTGYLRSTIKTFAGDGFAAMTVTAYYAYYQEKGTSRNRAHPFFYQNLTSHSVDIIIAVRQLYMAI